MKTSIKYIFSLSLAFSLASVNNSYSQYFTYVNPLTRTLDMSNAKVGTLPGSIDVSLLGSATYVIPIFVSPGTAGMQPQISLVYNSSFNDGIMGIGWDIGGLSEIRRISQSFYNDNNNTGVKLQNTDRFALDSNRLILTSQHQYGADNSEYATESEMFVKVIAHGTAGTGPAWFEVKTKDGRTLEYGNTADSKVEANGSSTVYMWRLNKVTDANNNSIEYEYYEAYGESYIKQINYTKNFPAGLTTNYNSLKFNYYSSPRTDINTTYVGGSQIPKTKLLSSIRMETEGGSLVREYQFLYHLDTYTHLNQIIEKGSDNSVFNATVFGWGTTTNSNIGQDVFNNGIKNKFYFGDYNGDGRTDFVSTENKTSFTTSDKWKLYLANTSGTSFTFTNEGSLNSDYKGFIVADVDADGNDDILWRKRETIYYQCNPHLCDGYPESKGDSISAAIDPVAKIDLLLPPPEQDTCWDVCSYQREAFYHYYYNASVGLTRGSSSYDIFFDNAPTDISLVPADLDGNGYTDYIVFNANKSIYTTYGISAYGYPYYNTPSDVRLIDFDSNNKTDLLVISGSGCYIYQLNTTTHYYDVLYSSSTYPTTSDRIFTGDFNGDKKTDILSWKNSTWSVKLSTGTGFVSSTNPITNIVDPNLSITDYNYYTGDFNGDRKDDILEVYKYGSASKFKIFFSKGGGNWDNELHDFSMSSINQDFISIRDINGDGQKDIFYYDYNLTGNYVTLSFIHKDELKHVIKSIANGFNLKSQLVYRRINSDTDTTFFKKTGDAAFPLYDFKGPLYVVASLVVGDSTSVDYRYQGAKVHRQGKGFLGFYKSKVKDMYNHFETTNYFAFNTTYYRRDLYKQTFWYVDIFPINELNIENQVISFSNKRYFPYVYQTTAKDLAKDIKIVTYNTFDNYGNLISDSTIFENLNDVPDAIKTVKNTWAAYGNYGIPNKTTHSTINSQYTGQTEYIREISNSFDTQGNLTIAKSDPQKTNEVTKTYAINNYGLPSQVTISATGLTTRTTLFEYDPKYRFITKQTNPLGHYTQNQYLPGTGNVSTFTGIDNKTTAYTYDGFGRLSETTTPLGNTITESLNWDQSLQGGANSLYSHSTSNPGSPFRTEYFNSSGQKIKSGIQEPGGEMVYSETEYSSLGNVWRESRPHFEDEPPNAINWTEYYRDMHGRTWFVISETGGVTFEYSGRSTTTIFPGNRQKKYTVNALGDVISIKENNDNNLVTSYTYHSNGKIKEINSAGNIVSTSFDDYGNPISVTSPNAGISIYSYNAFGELTKFTDARSDSTRYFYDETGRLDYFISPEGTTDYSYVSSGNGIEQIQSITGPGPGNISYTYSYDEYGRVAQFTESVPADQKSFTTAFGYDSYGNNNTINYPGGFNIKNVFNYGYLNEIRKEDNSLIWKLDASTSLLQPLHYTLGPGNITTEFSYDTLGFLTKKVTAGWKQTFKFENYTGNLLERGYRNMSVQDSLRETFTYDNLERLTSSAVTGQQAVSLSYDYNGNILSKTSVGAYEYLQDKINAVNNITGNTGAIPFVPQNITYSSYNKPLTIGEGIYDLSITYGPDQQRVKTVLKENGNIVKTKYYSINLDQEITSAGTRNIYYLYSPYGLVAINIRQNNVDNLYFTDTDHLGSIVAMLNPDGTICDQYSYDPWGRRRNPEDWTYSNVPIPVLIDRGYTGHEHLDKFNLINMNGRVYDPVLGRFLSPDPIIQSPDFTQSFNSYSYCVNNPLKFADPSGYRKECNYNERTETFWGRLWANFVLWLRATGGDRPNEDFENHSIDTGWDLSDKGIPYNLLQEITIGGGGDGGETRYSLGPGKPDITVLTEPTNPTSKNLWQRLSLEVWIWGDQYSKYNFIQSMSRLQKHEGKVEDWRPDPDHFYNDKWDEQYFFSPTFGRRKGANGYFQDGPNAMVWFKAELTICGSKGNKWEILGSFAWGYSVNNGNVIRYFRPIEILNPIHQNNVNNIINAGN